MNSHVVVAIFADPAGVVTTSWLKRRLVTKELFCPLLANDYYTPYCQKSKCAWWLEQWECCSVKAYALVMTQPIKVPEIIKEED
jgi:hypothetical protein